MWGREQCFQFEHSDVDIRIQDSGQGTGWLTIKVSELLIRELYVNCARCAVSGLG